MDLNNLKKDILNCDVKDKTGLNDFQKLPAKYSIEIPQVGINRFRVPLSFLHKETQSVMNHDCQASLYINLMKGKTGINMSRLCQILIQESQQETVNFKFLESLASIYQDRLRDNESEPLMKEVSMKFDFDYPLKQNALSSDNWGWQYYKSSMETKVSHPETIEHFLKVQYEYSSTCPCSLSMSKQYETEYSEGKVKQGSGIATAHSQRSIATCKIKLSNKAVEDHFFIEELVEILRKSIPTETQVLVKRADEQAFAILNGENPMFVEHACKRLHFELENNEEYIQDWTCFVEHRESLHSHNAAAAIYKNIPNGLRSL